MASSNALLLSKWCATNPAATTTTTTTTTFLYQACTAPNCTVVIKRHSRSVDINKHCCGRCQGKLMEIEVPGSKGDTAKAGHTPKTPKKASPYAIFVKEQSASVRQSLAKERQCLPKQVSQADVMKECGKLWRSRKSSEKDGLDGMSKSLSALTLD